jgi:hypothetical protein
MPKRERVRPLGDAIGTAKRSSRSQEHEQAGEAKQDMPAPTRSWVTVAGPGLLAEFEGPRRPVGPRCAVAKTRTANRDGTSGRAARGTGPGFAGSVRNLSRTPPPRDAAAEPAEDRASPQPPLSMPLSTLLPCPKPAQEQRFGLQGPGMWQPWSAGTVITSELMPTKEDGEDGLPAMGVPA